MENLRRMIPLDEGLSSALNPITLYLSDLIERAAHLILYDIADDNNK
jgi:hypothetical protein